MKFSKSLQSFNFSHFITKFLLINSPGPSEFSFFEFLTLSKPSPEWFDIVAVIVCCVPHSYEITNSHLRVYSVFTRYHTLSRPLLCMILWRWYHWLSSHIYQQSTRHEITNIVVNDNCWHKQTREINITILCNVKQTVVNTTVVTHCYTWYIQRSNSGLHGNIK